MTPLQLGFYGIIGAIQDRDTQAERNGAEGFYEVTLSKTSRDCDGPMYYKDRYVWLSEEEIPFFLADYFGLGGWEYTFEVDEDRRARGTCFHSFKTEEGNETRIARIFWGVQS